MFLFQSIVGVAGGSTRAALTQHQARRNNMADVSAKDGSQVCLSFLLWTLKLWNSRHPWTDCICLEFCGIWILRLCFILIYPNCVKFSEMTGFVEDEYMYQGLTVHGYELSFKRYKQKHGIISRLHFVNGWLQK